MTKRVTMTRGTGHKGNNYYLVKLYLLWTIHGTGKKEREIYLKGAIYAFLGLTSNYIPEFQWNN